MSNLIASCGELKPLHTWHHHLSWFLSGFYPCENLELVFISIPSSSSSKRISFEYLVMFLMLEVLPVHLLKRGQTLLLCYPPHMMDYDVYMHDLIVLVVTFGTSPRS